MMPEAVRFLVWTEKSQKCLRQSAENLMRSIWGLKGGIFPGSSFTKSTFTAVGNSCKRSPRPLKPFSTQAYLTSGRETAPHTDLPFWHKTVSLVFLKLPKPWNPHRWTNPQNSISPQVPKCIFFSRLISVI